MFKGKFRGITSHGATMKIETTYAGFGCQVNSNKKNASDRVMNTKQANTSAFSSNRVNAVILYRGECCMQWSHLVNANEVPSTSMPKAGMNGLQQGFAKTVNPNLHCCTDHVNLKANTDYISLTTRSRIRYNHTFLLRTACNLTKPYIMH